MKILMLAPQPFFEPRGTPFSVLGRLKALSELGHEVDLVTYHVGRDVAIPGITIHRTPKIGFIKSVKIGPSAPKIPLDFLVLAKAIQLLRKGRYDLLHTHEEASFFGVLLARMFRTRHIYDMHSSPPQQLSNFQYTRFRPLIRLFEWIEGRVISSSDAVITICPALEDYVTQINGHVLQMMIENVASERDPETISESELQAFNEANPFLDNRRVVLYAGTFEPYQGLDLLVKSAMQVVSRYKDVMFLMVGGKPEQIEHYQRRVNELGLSQYFYFTGSRPPEDIPLFIRRSDVLVSPRTDGTNTPLKIYAYLQSGKPIVATKLYTHTQVLNPDISVLAEPEPESFAEGVLSVLEDHSFAAKIGTNARQHFERNYSFQSYLQKTDQVLQLAVR